MIVSDSWTANGEQIASTCPDFVIASVPYQEKSVSEIIKTGTRFLGLAPRTLADIYDDIAIIAGLVGAPERGDKVIAEMQKEIAETRTNVGDTPRPRVFCEEWGKPIIRSQKWVAELVEAAGGEFLGTPGAMTNAEEVLAEAPDVIVAAWCGARDRVPLQKIVRDRGWTEMNAVKRGRIYCVRDDFLNTPAPTLLHGLRALAGAIHPDRFPHADGQRCVNEE